MATVLVTGSNRGIGLEFCKQLAMRGDEVIAACRQASAALKSLAGNAGLKGRVEIHEGLDVTEQDAIDNLVKGLAGRRLDLLINNAGLLQHKSRVDELDLDSIRQQFEINALGPLRLTSALLPLLAPGSKVALMTSRMGSITDNTSGGAYGYRMSKAALNIAGVSLAHNLKERQIAVVLLHPGFVRTEMTGGQGNLEADEAALDLIARIDALDLTTSGSFWHANGEKLPW